MSKQHIEVEGGELAIRNSHGDIAIIPKADKEKVQKMIDAGCNTCIDRYVNKLPRLQHYAADGTLYPIPDTLSDDPLEDWEKLAYIWNSPSRLVLGDAQGKEENTYVKNVGKYREIVTNINKQ